MVEPEEIGLAYPQAAHIWSEGAFDQHKYLFSGYFAEAGLFSVPKIGADRDLGSGAGSMVETLQVKNGQSAPFWTCSKASGVKETAISADLEGLSPTGAP